LDDFKFVNDSLGHAAGDELLQQTAQRVLATAPAGATVARLGGDEFAVIVCDDDAYSAATQLAQRILDALAEPVSINGVDVTIGCSIGLDYTRPHTASVA